MIAEYRRDFNARFTPEKYLHFLRLLEEKSGAPVKFRCSETPCFFPLSLLEAMAAAGTEIVHQLTGNCDYLAAAERVIPEKFQVPHTPDHPLFVQADFGIIRDADGSWQPRLVEIQGFPSLYGFQLTMAHAYREAYGLEPGLRTMLGGLSEAEYDRLLQQAIVAERDPENVVLLEIDPLAQKTLSDFLVTERICGIRTVDIREVRRHGRKLFYLRDGVETPIERIYNRAIADELIRRDIALPFDFRDDLEVEWAGHPNWFFLLSKFSLPWLRHPTVPRTWFLNDVFWNRSMELPAPPETLVLKPLFSFAGMGVTIGPTREEIEAIAPAARHEYILQERVHFEPTIATPPGVAKAEVRIMYIWLESEMRPVNTIIRTGRGKMMGVDQNRDLDWVGASAGFYP